jgi:hypothetical protein
VNKAFRQPLFNFASTIRTKDGQSKIYFTLQEHLSKKHNHNLFQTKLTKFANASLEWYVESHVGRVV